LLIKELTPVKQYECVREGNNYKLKFRFGPSTGRFCLAFELGTKKFVA
jgi:hypothetical protein